jgi:hypothetical protein
MKPGRAGAEVVNNSTSNLVSRCLRITALLGTVLDLQAAYVV